MIRRKTLNPNERLLIESPVNRYRIVGPGRVYLTVRQRILAKLYVGPQARSLQFEEVRTAEDVPLKITLKVIYRANPELFTCDLLPKIPGLNDKGWASSVEWHAEYVLRQLVAHRSWQEIGRDEVQKRLERQFTQTLEDRLKMLGLQVLAGCVIKTALPASLQQTLIQAERDRIEAVSRANILKSYLEVFGQNLPQAMPYIVQWEMMNTIHKNNPHILLTPNGSLGNPPCRVTVRWAISFNCNSPSGIGIGPTNQIEEDVLAAKRAKGITTNKRASDEVAALLFLERKGIPSQSRNLCRTNFSLSHAIPSD